MTAGPNAVLTIRPGNPQAAAAATKENAMQYAVIYAFVVIACAPLIGIWRGHVWAKANGLVLRSTATATEQDQPA